MPVNFFNVSETYLKRVPEATRAKLDAIAAHSKENYKIKRGTMAGLVESLNVTAKNGQSSLSKLGSQFRYALDFYKGAEEEKKAVRDRMEKKGEQVTMLKYLLQDGFDTWEKIEAALRGEDQGAAASEAGDSAEASALPAASDSVTDTTKTGPVDPRAVPVLEENSAEFFIISRETIEQFKGLIGHVVHVVERLRDRSQHIGSLVDAVQQENNSLTAELSYVLEEATRLEGLVANRAPAKEVTATDLGVDKLDSVLHEAAAESALAGNSEGRLAVEALPNRGAFAGFRGRPIVYSGAFRNKYLTLSRANQSHVIKALELFAQHGSTYPSLKTKKLNPGSLPPHTPEGSMSSRGNHEVRFSWRTESEQITVYYVFLRGEAGWSEA